MNNMLRWCIRLAPIMILCSSCISPPVGKADDPSAHELYRAAIQLVRQGEFISAEKVLLRARALEPENASYALYLGWLYIQHLHDARHAAIHLEEAQRLDPSKTHLWSNLARTYRTLERWQDAGNAYQKVLEGNVVLTFEEVFIDSKKWEPVTNKSYTPTENWGVLDVVNAQATAVSLLPLVNTYLAEKQARITDYDSILLYFSPEGIADPRPSASVLYKKDFEQWFGSREQIGCISIPLVVYHASEGVYVHEYFHLLENRYGISPKHGFSPDHHYKENKRQHFPEWKGSGQFSYFHYHFLHTIKPSGYKKALHP